MSAPPVASRPLSLADEIRALARLAAPMMAAQGGLMTMGVVDTAMIGRIGALEMGAVALGNSVAVAIMVLGLGLVMGLEPLASQAHGAQERASPRRWLGHGLWLSVIASIPLGLLMVAATFALEPAGVEPHIADVTASYIFSRLPGLPFNIAFGACRCYLSSVERTRPIFVVVLFANFVNLALDGLLLFYFDLGAVGVGLATSACWAVMFVGMARASLVDGGGRLFGRFDWTEVKKVARLGWPIGFHLTVEVGIFAMVGLLVARFGEKALAGHHIALTLASLSFMAGVGLSVAASARVGMHIGAGRPLDARRSGFISIGLGAGSLGVGGMLFLIFPEALARQFAPHDPEVVAAGAALLQIAAVFSVSDGIQVVASGALRGAGDTRWPFYAHAVAHWGVGLPAALYLGFTRGMAAEGFWWALSISLTAVAIVLTLRFRKLSGRVLERV